MVYKAIEQCQVTVETEDVLLVSTYFSVDFVMYFYIYIIAFVVRRFEALWISNPCRLIRWVVKL